MRIFVTGGLGFIGAHFVERALAEGHCVTGLYRSERPERAALLASLRARGADLRRGDILEVSTFDSALIGADCVCHFAAAFKEASNDASYFEHINVEGMNNVIAAAARHQVRRFVFCSTAGIYGQRVSGVVNETAVPQPWNPYERSKLAAEIALRERTRALGMEYVILRPTAVYGPRDARLLKLFRSAARGRFPLFGPGDGCRHMVYVSDVAVAFLRACIEKSAANQDMIIAGPQAVPLRQLLAILAKAVQRPRCGPRLPLWPMLYVAACVEDICSILRIKPPIYRRRMDFYLHDAAFDCTRARQALGWKPEVDLEEGLARTLHACQLDKLAETRAVLRALAFLILDCTFLWDLTAFAALAV